MSFTASELRLLQIADQAEEGRGVGGPRRTKPNTPQVERKRARDLRRWHGLPPVAPVSRGGRPRAPYVNAKTERRRERQRRYYRRKLNQEMQP